MQVCTHVDLIRGHSAVDERDMHPVGLADLVGLCVMHTVACGSCMRRVQDSAACLCIVRVIAAALCRVGCEHACL